MIRAMNIKLAENKEKWDAWFLDQGNFEFLQSWDWGEFQRSTGKDIFRLECEENGQIKAQVQVFAHTLFRGLRYAYAPRIPVSKKLIQALQDFFEKKNFLFLRIEPQTVAPLFSSRTVRVPCRQPQYTLILDFEKTPQQLLEGMHPKTRYNIRLAQKKNLSLNQEKNVDVFFALNEQTTQRDGFKSHDKEYYKKMLELPFVHQINAVYEGTPVASVLLLVWGKRCTYLHGASSNEHRSTMAPHLLQWAGIQLARQLQCTEYDFWGIAPIVNNESEANALSFHGYKWQGNHRFAGVTRFKVGFGGEVKNYPDAFEVPLKFIPYQLYRLLKKIGL